MPTVPLAREVGLTVIVGQTGVSVKARVATQVFASVALRVKVWAMALVGVPVTAPVVVLSVRPAGSVPLTNA